MTLCLGILVVKVIMYLSKNISGKFSDNLIRLFISLVFSCVQTDVMIFSSEFTLFTLFNICHIRF